MFCFSLQLQLVCFIFYVHFLTLLRLSAAPQIPHCAMDDASI
jgi:hypothetical protein